MSKIYKSVSELIGSTPLLEISFLKDVCKDTKVLAKLECFNPAGSVKDRVAKEIIEDAERKGLLKKGSIIVEPTSGNTGIGISAICAQKGYKAIIVMPDNMSKERIRTMQSFGAEVVLTDSKYGMAGAVERADEIIKNNPGSLLAGQFTNQANVYAHIKTTGPEIYNDTDAKVDIFVAGVGTGGTITGVGKYLKSKNPSVKIVAVEPDDSPLLSEGKAGPHKIQGIGANFVPEVLDVSVIDEVIRVTTDQAYEHARLMGKNEGILVGISSGAALYGAHILAKREENKGKTIVALLPDTGDRYLSTDLFE